jgi:hypothetical protein
VDAQGAVLLAGLLRSITSLETTESVNERNTATAPLAPTMARPEMATWLSYRENRDGNAI